MIVRPLPAPLRWRHAQPGDAPFLDALFLASRDDLRQIPLEAAMLQLLVRLQQQVQEDGLRQNYPGAVRLVIEREAVPVGQAVVDVGPRELRLLDLGVVPGARRGGVARTVLAHLQQEAAARGVPIGLTVAVANAPARSLYAGLGFGVVAQDAMVQHLAWRAGAPA